MTGMERTRSGGATWSWSRTAIRWIVPLLLVLAGLGLGAALQAWRAAPGANSVEVTWARDMAAHHAQAVEMAAIIRDRTTNEELRFVTMDMILTQQAQIGQMHGWLNVWQQPLAGAAAPMNGMGEQMGMASAEQIAQLSALPVDQAEVLFLQLMIRHHQGGLIMAEDVLGKTTQPHVVRLATAIRDGQSSEIRFMEQRLRERGAALPEPLAPMEQHHH